MLVCVRIFLGLEVLGELEGNKDSGFYVEGRVRLECMVRGCVVGCRVCIRGLMLLGVIGYFFFVGF